VEVVHGSTDYRAALRFDRSSQHVSKDCLPNTINAVNSDAENLCGLIMPNAAGDLIHELGCRSSMITHGLAYHAASDELFLKGRNLHFAPFLWLVRQLPSGTHVRASVGVPRRSPGPRQRFKCP
jgi:hypothetical protein